MIPFPSLTRLALPLLALFFLAGCQQYQLQGRVVQGPETAITVVNADDPRLDQPGLAQATVQVTIDPNSLGRRNHLPPVPADESGTFAIPLEELGAGFLQYDLGIVARKPNYETAQGIIPLPAASKRLLITLNPGSDRYQAPEDPFENVDHFMKQMK